MSVKFLHIRNWDNPKDLEESVQVISGKGGMTIAYYYLPASVDTSIRFAVAKCHNHENFNRKIGRDIAEGRLLKNRNTVTLVLNDRKPVQAILEYLENEHA